MATTADVLRSVNAILQSGERREQYKVQTALSMMQFAQQKRMQDIALTQKNLDLAQKSLQQQKPIVASEFLSATRLGGIYQQTEEGETAEDAISEMVKTLRSKQYLGKKYDRNKAHAIAGAVWNYYSAEDPTSIIRLGSNLYDASIAMEAGEQTPDQHELFDAFMKLGVTADLKDISMAAKKARVSEQYISKEISEFLQGDYEIQSPIGIYADIPEAVEEADMDRRLKETPAPAEYTEMETTREALRDAEGRYKGLQNKMDTNMATDEEKEEFYELPNLMDKFRIELGSSSESLQSSVQDELDDIDKQISDMQDAGLARSKQYGEIKRKRIEKRREYLALTQQAAEERFRETKSSEIENVSELLGVSTSEAEPYYEGAKARELARFGR
jgi:hypothetical protein